LTKNEGQQRVINDTLIITIPCITEAPGIIQSQNPTTKCTLQTMPCLHRHVTWNNILGILPGPAVVPPVPILAAVQMYHPTPSGACSQIVTREAINALTASKLNKCHNIFAPGKLPDDPALMASIRPKHFACPMVHPITSKTILSCKKLMNDPAMTET
jgi:hypothetical protein